MRENLDDNKSKIEQLTQYIRERRDCSEVGENRD